MTHTPAGYEALLADAGAYEDPSRLVLEARGSRAREMLNAIVTADLKAVRGDAAFPTLVLTPKGRVLADAVVVCLGDRVWLDVPSVAWPDLEDHFSVYLPPRFVSFEETGLRVVRVHGPRATEREKTNAKLAALNGPTFTQRDGSHRAVVAFQGGCAVRLSEGFDLYLPEDEAHGFALPRVSEPAWDTWRVERGVPVFGRDISKDNLPQEVGLVPETVSFSKGCYTGQEVLARIHYRGHVNRHLRGLRFTEVAAGDPVNPGDELVQGKKTIGVVTSVVRSPTYGLIGLGYVRREVEPGAEVGVRAPRNGSDVPLFATVTDLPFGA